MDTSEQESLFFIPNEETWRTGYFINVRNRFNNKDVREYIDKEMKEIYVEEFGETVIDDDTFLSWYAKTKKNIIESQSNTKSPLTFEDEVDSVFF